MPLGVDSRPRARGALSRVACRRTTRPIVFILGWALLYAACSSVSHVSYPSTIYPQPVPAAGAGGVVQACPNPEGLEAPGPHSRAQAIEILVHLGGLSLTYDLQHTDQTLWQEQRSVWSSRHFMRVGRPGILYGGPLLATLPQFGVPNPASWIQAACGAPTVRASYLLVTEAGSNPALQVASLFVQRTGQLLLYFNY